MDPHSTSTYDPYKIGKGKFFPEMPVHRRVVPRGIPGVLLFFGATIMGIKWNRDAAGYLRDRKARKEELYDARTNVLPILKAEEDRNYLKARSEDIAMEEKYCKDLPGFIVGGGVYNTTWMPPTFPPGYRGSSYTNYS